MTDAHPSAEMILNTSPEAATYRTDVKGWVSRNGRYCGTDERTARYEGCTHVVCDCGIPIHKGRVRCDVCQAKRDREDWLALPLVPWDGETPLCIFRGDDYFFDYDDVERYCDNYGVKMSELMIVTCEPNYPRTVDAEYWCDDLPEDGELPGWLEKAVDALNAVILAHKDEPLSWHPGKSRVVLEDERQS